MDSKTSAKSQVVRTLIGSGKGAVLLNRCVSRLALILALLICFARSAFAGPLAANPSQIEIARVLEAAARQNRVPSVLLKGLAWHESGWRQWEPDNKLVEHDGRVGLLGVPAGGGRKDADRLRTDWRYNIEQGTRALVRCWNRAPIIGNGRLDDGRNILECWFFALGRYGVGSNGDAANAYASRVLDAVASGGAGRWAPVSVSRPAPDRLALSKNLFGPPVPWHFGDILPRPAAIPVVSLAVPYVNQVYDVPPDHDGSGACGPSSMVMVLAFLNKVAPKPITVPDPLPHESRFGALVPAVQNAVCEPNLGAVHAKMLDYLRPTFPNVAIFYDDKATWARVKSELDAGRPVILGTRVTPAGHLMVARGYLSDGRLLINDPAGDREQAARRPSLAFSPTGVRYWNRDGDKAVYEWDALDVRWVMTVGDSAAGSDRAEDE